MFLHNLKYNLKVLFKNKSLIFWTFAFPIILGFLFNLAFSNIEESEKLDIINIGIVENEKLDENFLTAIKYLGDKENEDRLFEIKYLDEDDAEKYLDESKISAYISYDNDIKITIKENGINQTITKNVVDEIIQQTKLTENIIKKDVENQMLNGNFNIDYESIYSNAYKVAGYSYENTKDISKENISYTMIEYYTLIAMTALYGGIIAMTSLNNNLANMSNKGKRVAVAPTKKIATILSSLVASYIIQLIGMILLFLFTIFVIKVDYGNQLGKIILLALIGILSGLSLGMFVGSVLKTNEASKVGIIIAITMLGSFLSGMMGITMKYIIDSSVPIVNKLNPAAMITDGLYSLYYYNTFDRYYFNIISLLIFSTILILISCISLRRQKYDSI